MTPCPCCGYKTLSEAERGSGEICPVCYWEDDEDQAQDPDLEGGANVVSLRQAQLNYEEFCACEPESRKFVRLPAPEEARDADWEPLADTENPEVDEVRRGVVRLMQLVGPLLTEKEQHGIGLLIKGGELQVAVEALVFEVEQGKLVLTGEARALLVALAGKLSVDPP